MPVRLKMRHCDSGIERWSPMVRATITPRTARRAAPPECAARIASRARKHDIRGAAGESVHPPVALVGAHVARRAEAVLEQPRLDVEAMRVDRAVRSLQADDELPALAGGDLRNGIRDATLVHLGVPGE